MKIVDSISILLVGLSVFVLTLVLHDERETNRSHWKATEHELNYMWSRINELEGDVVEID